MAARRAPAQGALVHRRAPPGANPRRRPPRSGQRSRARSGADPRHADVTLSGGRIAEVGPPGSLSRAREEIDAEGLALMPGIVDNHTHYDAQVTWDPWCSPSPQLGVTTAVIGNCGFTIAPCRPGDRER
ncbi:MAG: hypothetical protein EB049_05165, partial [Actinobacteria bacterium]|nr:hypothetical protein [Actinomycetota bacterium]